MRFAVHEDETSMRLLAHAAIAALIATGFATTAQAEPGGCLKYGAVGAVGGHLAHHHAVLGAAGGCAVGMYKRHEYRKHHKHDLQVPPQG